MTTQKSWTEFLVSFRLRETNSEKNMYLSVSSVQVHVCPVFHQTPHIASMFWCCFFCQNLVALWLKHLLITPKISHRMYEAYFWCPCHHVLDSSCICVCVISGECNCLLQEHHRQGDVQEEACRAGQRLSGNYTHLLHNFVCCLLWLKRLELVCSNPCLYVKNRLLR